MIASSNYSLQITYMQLNGIKHSYQMQIIFIYLTHKQDS